jgi:hypothetical protein
MTYRELLIEMVKAAGQEVINRAEDIVGNGELMTDFDIWLRFPRGEIPTIDCTRSYISKQSFDVYKELKGKQEGGE